MSMQSLADDIWLAEWLIGMGDVAVQRVRDVITRHDDEAALVPARFGLVSEDETEEGVEDSV